MKNEIVKCQHCGTQYYSLDKCPMCANVEELNNVVKNKINETVNHPSHYNTGKIEVIDFIEDQNLGFNTGNAVKYIARAGKKNPEKHEEDIEKAIWYLHRELSKIRKR